MRSIPLDVYEDMPSDMKKYINNYGWHFNKKAHDYAVSLIKTKGDNKFKPYNKSHVDELLSIYNVKLDNMIMHDYVYAANMCKADFYGSSIEDDKHLVMFIKDVVDDVDASTETTFRRWVATMIGNGVPIDWSEIC